MLKTNFVFCEFYFCGKRIRKKGCKSHFVGFMPDDGIEKMQLSAFMPRVLTACSKVLDWFWNVKPLIKPALLKFWSIKFSIGCYQEALFDSDLLLNLRIKVGTIDKRQKTGEHSQRTPNKLTNELRLALKNALFDKIVQLPSRLDKLDVTRGLSLPLNSCLTWCQW